MQKTRSSLLALFLILLTAAGCSFHPKPMTMEDISQRAESDLQKMFADQEPVSETVTLYTAMARAIKYNLDYRLQLMEKSMAGKILNASKYDLLPQIAANAGYNNRSEYHGASSYALKGPTKGEQSLVTSTSQEKDIRTADVTVMWNVLDFGLSYYRAKQNADSVMISEEIRRKVIQNVIQDVRYAYWRAAGSDALLTDMRELLARSQTAFEQSRQIAGQNLQPRLETLRYQHELLNNIRILWNLIQILAPAKTELATLMNVKPGTQFILVDPDWDRLPVPEFTTPVETLEEMAMVYRPELREEDYKARISAAEVRKAIINMMPGINLVAGYNYDSNKFLYKNNWWNAGVQASLNLINLVSGPADYDVAKTRQEVDAMRRQALAIGVMAQVHIALQRYGLAKEEYLITSRLESVDTQLSRQMVAEQASGRVTALAMIQSETEAMVSRVRRQIAYAEIQNSSGMIYNSLGIDLMPETVAALDVQTLADELEASFARWKAKVNPAVTN